MNAHAIPHIEFGQTILNDELLEVVADLTLPMSFAVVVDRVSGRVTDLVEFDRPIDYLPCDPGAEDAA